MKARLLILWDNFRTGFWFLPLLLVVAAIGLAVALSEVDSRTDDWLVERIPRLATTTAAARATLSAIGGAMITVTGVVFSITIVALSIASSQFGSRVLRNFTDDRVTQGSIGILIATSLYCFLVMRSVRELGGQEFVPHISVAVAVLLAMASVAVLILFIHHVALAIQAPMILESLGRDLDASIDRLFPEKIGSPPTDGERAAADATEQAERLGDGWAEVLSDHEGYVQAIDAEGLIEAAQRHDFVVELDKRPGDFLVRGGTVGRLWPADRLCDEVAHEVNDTIIVGSRRTPRQDVGCTVDDMVQVAVRALSPGINDPFTAVNCIDRLSASLTRLAARKLPSAHRCDPQGRLRVVAHPASFEEVLDDAFDQIRRSGRRDVLVMNRLLDAVELILQETSQPEYRQALVKQADMLLEAFELGEHQACDANRFRRRYEALRSAADRREGGRPASDGQAQVPAASRAN